MVWVRRIFTGVLHLALVASFAATASPVQAMDLLSSDPAANSTIKTAPSAVTLTLSSEILETGSSISVLAPSGRAVDDGSLLIEGSMALIGLATLTESGRHTVTYQLMSADGELLSGSYSFTFDAPAVVSTPIAPPSGSPSPEESEASPGQATGKSSLATDIFMISLLVISFLVLIFISRSLRKTKPKKRKKK
jgi:methionine-rich copper-binding protein CopC